MDESYHTYDRVISHIRMSHVTHISMSQVTHINESHHAYECTHLHVNATAQYFLVLAEFDTNTRTHTYTHTQTHAHTHTHIFMGKAVF